jgi:hypothetical protein
LELSQISARFFLELALGLFAGLLLLDRRAIGAGFTRLTAALAVACLIPGLLLVRGPAGPSPGTITAVLFGAGCLLVLFLAGRPRPALETAIVAFTSLLGAIALFAAVRAQTPQNGAALLALASTSTLASTLVLGLVVGAMLLGHWYLVTPDLPVAHLGRFTAAALVAIYLKLALLALTAFCFRDRFGDAARGFAASLGIGGGSAGSFQSELDFLWLLARVVIGVVGPAILCHMTLATVRLKATQPATGILYAATVTVLMGELFAFVAERSFSVVL